MYASIGIHNEIIIFRLKFMSPDNPL